MTKKRIIIIIATTIALWFLVISTIKAILYLDKSNVQNLLFVLVPITLLVFALLIVELNSVALKMYVPKNKDIKYLPNIVILGINNNNTFGEKEICLKKVKEKLKYNSVFLLIENKSNELTKIGLKGIKIKSKSGTRKAYFNRNVKIAMTQGQRKVLKFDFKEKEYKLISEETSSCSILLSLGFKRNKFNKVLFKNFNFYDKDKSKCVGFKRVFTYFCQINGEKFKKLELGDNTIILPEEYLINSEKYSLELKNCLSKSILSEG